MGYNYHTETTNERNEMQKYNATDNNAPTRVVDVGGDFWRLVRKPDTRDNCYELEAEFYFRVCSVRGYTVDANGWGILSKEDVRIKTPQHFKQVNF